MSDELSSVSREMLDRAVSDEQELLPSTDRRRQLKRALLQTAVVSGVGSATLAKAAALEGSRLASSAAANAPWLTLGKSVLVGLVASGGILGTVQLASTRSDPAREPAPVLRATSSAANTTAVPRTPTPAPPELSQPESEPAPAVAALSPPAKASAGSPPTSSDPALRAELELMTAAQAALRDGKPAQALALLERYDATFPAGQLGRERLAAEVFGACQLGDRARATRAATRFLQHDTESALARRVRQACPFSNSETP